MKVKSPKGVIFNAYPDSIGHKLSDIARLLQRPEFSDAFSFFYILPSCFHSDLDRGFSIIDYDLNETLCDPVDLFELKKLGLNLKFDLILNHLSVRSPQFQDLLRNGDQSEYIDFFIDWNAFWQNQGEMCTHGYILPREEHLKKLFTRKPGLPFLKVRFPDDSDRFYWNTFYQEVNYAEITAAELANIDGITDGQARQIAKMVNRSLKAKIEPTHIELGDFSELREDVLSILEQKSQYLGQMDLNADSEKVWAFYEEILQKIHRFGAKIVRLDAFAYLHKQPGMVNFFNKPGTWNHLDRLKRIADRLDMVLLPEIHSEYGSGIYLELAERGYLIYDFFLPGLLIDALDGASNKHLLRWFGELVEKEIHTVNMLGCHDGIPILDLRGRRHADKKHSGLLADKQIERVIENIVSRGGLIKNLFGPDGKKIAYYQVNATFFSALGEDDQKMRLARAIQLFAPGTPQVWYLDLFAGKNNCQALNRSDACSHKEINRTNLSLVDVEEGLKQAVVQDQLTLLRFRNTSPAFNGNLEIGRTKESQLDLTWQNGSAMARLQADLRDHRFCITYADETGSKKSMSFL
jgi:sucrose phosphorylase